MSILERILQYLKDKLSDLRLKLIQLGLEPFMSVLPKDTPILEEQPEIILKPTRELPDPIIDNTPAKPNETYSRQNKIWKNYYDTTIEMITSAQNRNSLYKLIDKQINNKIIKLPEDIIKERIAYAFVIAEAYNLNKKIDYALISQTPLPKKTQNIIFEEIRQIGAQGEGARKEAQERHLRNPQRYTSYENKNPQTINPNQLIRISTPQIYR